MLKAMDYREQNRGGNKGEEEKPTSGAAIMPREDEKEKTRERMKRKTDDMKGGDTNAWGVG